MPREGAPLVLLAEDQAVIAFSLGDALEETGFTIAGPMVTCTQALSWLAGQRPDAAIIDLELKDGPCTELARELRRQAVPFLVYSGQQRAVAPAEFSEAPWIEKPAASESIASTLKGLLSAAS